MTRSRRRAPGPHIPEDATWYLADLVETISVSGDPRVVVHTNSVLIRADSSAEAHSRALALGRAAPSSYRNGSGQRVTVRFLGLHELNVLHDRLEHGAEISYRERIVRSAGVAKKLVKPKGGPGVFAPRQANRGPDYLDANLRARMVAAGALPPPAARRTRTRRRKRR